jgi:hypothetical protein
MHYIFGALFVYYFTYDNPVTEIMQKSNNIIKYTVMKRITNFGKREMELNGENHWNVLNLSNTVGKIVHVWWILYLTSLLCGVFSLLIANFAGS